MLVRDIMTPDPIVIEPDTSLAQAMQLMRDRRIRRLPVVAGGQLVGIVTDRDLKEAAPSSGVSLTAWELTAVMSRTTMQGVMREPVLTLPSDASVERAMRLMLERKIGGIPVVDEGKVVGIVTESDIFRVLADLMERTSRQC